jgi:hypothetical protein
MVKFNPDKVEPSEPEFVEVYGANAITYDEVTYAGNLAVAINVLGNTVAVAEFPDGYDTAQSAFTNLTWGADYTVFPQEVRRLYSLDRIEGLYHRERTAHTYLAKVVSCICREILRGGLRLARYEYHKTGRKHTDGSPIYELRDTSNQFRVASEVVAPCFDLRRAEPDYVTVFVGWGAYLTSKPYSSHRLVIHPHTTFEDAKSKGVHKYGAGDDLPITFGSSNDSTDVSPIVDNRRLNEYAHRGRVVVEDGTVLSDVSFLDGETLVKTGTRLKDIKILGQSPTFPANMSITGYHKRSVPSYHTVYVEYDPGDCCCVNDGVGMCQYCWDYSNDPSGMLPLRVTEERTDYHTPYLVVGPIGYEDGTLTAVLDDSGLVKVTCGCFEGTLAEFEEKVDTVHKSSESVFYREYLAAIELIKARFAGSFFSRETLEAARTEDPTEG